MIDDVVAAVATDLTPRVPNLVVQRGRSNVYLEANQPPCITFVPTRDTYGPSENSGRNPRALRTRLAGAEVHIWGATYAATEALVHNFIASVHRVGVVGTYTLDGGEWVSETGTDLTNEGTLYVLNATFKIPVTDIVYQTTTITAEIDTAILALPSGDVTVAIK